MDAFYASVEQRDNPSLRGKPVIVGANPEQRGVVCAASYEARVFGVRSALPSSTARRLCPSGIFVRPRMEHYREESHSFMKLVQATGAVIEQVSIDEAYMDLTAVCRTDAPLDDDLLAAVAIARDLQQSILRERRLSASLGIASNKFLAKIASDFSKPKGLTLVPERDKVAFLRALPVGAIHGVGKVTAGVLARAGLDTIGSMQDYTGDLRSFVGSFGPVLRRFSFGEDTRPVEDSDETKSISCEETFSQDTDDRRLLRSELKEQAVEIAERMAEKKLGARTVQVKVRYSDFTTLTRQFSVEESVTTAAEIYRLGCFLLARDRLVHRPLRLLGLGVSGLLSPDGQLALPLEDNRG